MKKQFLVIGLGRFGASVAATLTEAGHSVVGIDQSETCVQRMSESIADVIKCDATDADILVYPEKDMGERVARSLISSNIIDFLEVSPDVSIIEIPAPETIVGKNLVELNLRHKYGVTIISIKNSKNEIMSPPNVKYIFQKDDILTLIGENKLLKKLRFTEHKKAVN